MPWLFTVLAAALALAGTPAVYGAAPAITALSPAAAVAGGAEFTLTVEGENFTPATTVVWETSELATGFVSAERVTAVVPAGLIAADGRASVTVRSESERSSPEVFTIELPAGDVDLLGGAWLRKASIVKQAAGAEVLTAVAREAAQTNALTPAATAPSSQSASASAAQGGSSASSDGAANSTSGGGSNLTSDTLTSTFVGSSSAGFAFTAPAVATPLAAPTIVTLSPSVAVAGGAAFTLTITGTNFTSTSSVKWGTTALATTYVSATQLTAAVSANLIASAGTASVTATNATGSSTAASFTINPPAPTIGTLSPSVAVAGGAAFTLTIKGTNYTSTSTVSWGTTALATTYVSATQLTAAVPASLIAGAGTASVTATNATGSSPAASFTINPPAPTITSLSVTSIVAASASFTLTINGTNFQPGIVGTQAKWNNYSLATTCASSTQLTAVIPANFISAPGTANITVTTAGGSSSGVLFTVTPAQPILSVMTMYSVPAGFGAFTLVLYGYNFTPTMIVNFGSAQLSGNMVGGSMFDVLIPASLDSTAGTVSVSVTTVGGTSSSVNFVIELPSPVLTSVSPSSVAAGGTSFVVTVNGQNFTSKTEAKIATTWLATTYVSATQLTAVVPASMIASAGNICIEVYIGGGPGWSNASCVTINPALPVMTSISPSALSAGGAGFTLIVNGKVFTRDATVTWGTTPLETVYVSPTELLAFVSAAQIEFAGTAGITVSTNVGTSSAATFTINQALSQISYINPGRASAGGAGFTMTISGANFTPASVVNWGSTSLATTYVNLTQLTVTVPASLIASAGKVSLTVITVVGTSAPATFIVNPPPIITTSTMPPGSVGSNYAGLVHVTGGTPGYHWNVTGLPASFTYATTFDSTLTISGMPTSPGAIDIQVSAQDMAGSTAGPVALTINVGGGPNGANNGSLNGNYVCLLQGSIDGDESRWASVINFTADGQGNFTSGVFDTNSRAFGSASGIMSGSYQLGADWNGMASIHTVLTNNAAGIQTTQWAIAASGNAQPATEFSLVEADDLGTVPSGQQGTGDCYLTMQSAFAASTVSGSSFAFGLDGEDNSGNIKAAVGEFSAASGAITGGFLDSTLGGGAADQSSAFSGKYTAPDPATGRFTIALNGALNMTGFTVYIIDAARMFILDNTSYEGEQAGEMRLEQQSVAGGSLLSGPFVSYARGAEQSAYGSAPTGFYAEIFAGTGDGQGNFTINQSYANNAGAYTAGGANSSPTALTFDSTHPGRASYTTASGTTYLYFHNADSAFAMSVGGSGAVDSGRLEAQTAAQTANAFSDAALAGNYLLGELPIMDVPPTGYAGVYDLSVGGAIGGAASTASQGALGWDQALSTSVAWDATAPGSGGFLVANGAEGAASCAAIGATKFVCVSESATAPSVEVMQQ